MIVDGVPVIERVLANLWVEVSWASLHGQSAG